MWALGWFWNTLCSLFYKGCKKWEQIFITPSLSSLCQLIHHNSHCNSITSVRTKPIWHLFPSISTSLLFQAKLSQFLKEKRKKWFQNSLPHLEGKTILTILWLINGLSFWIFHSVFPFYTFKKRQKCRLTPLLKNVSPKGKSCKTMKNHHSWNVK